MVVTGRPVGELRRAYDALRVAHDELKRAENEDPAEEREIQL